MGLNFRIFQNFPKLRYDFSDKDDGSMNRFLERNNRERYFKSADIDPRRVVTADLVHGVRTRRVFGEAAGTMIAGTDGLVTNKENLFLSATAADCFLLYLYDSERNTIGITHVGWRGLLGGVVENAIDVLAESFGVSPQDLFVGISPGIRRCHFEVSPADRKKFQEYADFIGADGYAPDAGCAVDKAKELLGLT